MGRHSVSLLGSALMALVLSVSSILKCLNVPTEKLQALQRPIDFSARIRTRTTEQEDWFDQAVWDSNPVTNNRCFIVENVCHGAQEWFYHPAINHKSRNSISIRIEHSESPQPNAYPSHLNIRNTTTFQRSSSDKNICRFSPIPNHMVLNGKYSYMLGEFYSRVFVHLADMFKFLTTTNVGEPDKLKENLFLEQTQLYLSLLPRESKNNLLEGHQLFLGLLTSNAVFPFKSLVDNVGCTCMQRLFMCGFSPPDQQGISKPKGSMELDRQHQRFNTLLQTNHGNSSMSIYEYARDLVLRLGVEENPVIRNKIQDFRIQTIKSAMYNNSMERSAIQERDWKIIGLIQRSSRRKWLNLDQALSLCNQQVYQNVACIEVNVESKGMESPVQHLITHGALDGFMSIHGATLGDALLLPRGALVVEMLPYVLGKQMGDWTRSVDTPTPCGVNLVGTDLTHVGLPLNRSSVLHLNCPGGKYGRQCFKRRRDDVPNPNSWDNRDFTVDPIAIMDLVQKFVLGNLTTCQESKNAAGDDYVLYNVNCSERLGLPGKVHQFYRDPEWIHIKTGSFANAT